MGQEIQKTRFNKSQFDRYNARLRRETELLAVRLAGNAFDNRHMSCGFELEGWLVDADYRPAPVNHRFLALANNPLLSAELALFNIELNTTPLPLSGKCLSSSEHEIADLLQSCGTLAADLGIQLSFTGTLPTLRESDLTIDNLSHSNRFAALNQQVLLQRKGRPLKVDINGHEHLHIEHMDVMLESTTTSFQVHFQVPVSEAVRYYNASIAASAATIGVSGNSPFLFGKQLWAETRIPLFEQAVEVGGYAGASQGPLKRVGFGSGYLKNSMLESFMENLEHFPVLLPTLFDTPPDEYAHLRLHNGTIWRWNRPLIGFSEDGCPHIRIEHRVIPAGPTTIDAMANAAFYYGLAHAFAQREKDIETQLTFTTAKDNFYKAARQGLQARVKWVNDETVSLKKLVLNTLLPIAKEGLQALNIDKEDRDLYLNIIRERTACGQTGAQWQVEFANRTGRDMRLLTETYLKYQRDNRPVHTWELPELPQKSREPELQLLDQLPEGFLQIGARDLHTLLKGPTLICLPGREQRGIFISVLLHGNEPSGLLAVQSVLSKYRDKPLPRQLYIFIGNIEAARYGLRQLNGQTDYNRAWPGTELPPSSESRLLAKVYEIMRDKDLLLSIDVHNNTGLNPHYGCVNRLDPQYLRLALLFSRTVVYFKRPRGVQAIAFAELCPAVTVECGKVGDQRGIKAAVNLIETCLSLRSLSNEPVDNRDIDLFHTAAQVKIPERLTFSFDDEPADINFSHELEYMNFREITPGTPFGDCAQLTVPPFIVLNEQGEDVYRDYFEVENGLLRVTRPVMPSMLTLDERIIRQDCFCYLMERIKLGKEL
ncbi:MAG TPA: M14 family metallopeptidase [Gammaproteobacteria bacterium]